MPTNEESEAPEPEAPKPGQGLVGRFRDRVQGWKQLTLAQRQERLRALDEERQRFKRESDAVLQQIEHEDPLTAIDAVHELFAKFGDGEPDNSWIETRAQIQRMQEESDALQRMRADAVGDNVRAASAYRAYLRDHPESSLAYLYLAGALEQLGDLEGALAAHREIVRLLSGQPSFLIFARCQVGRVLLAKGETAAAIAELRDIVDTSAAEEDLSLIYLQLGNALNADGDRSGARSAWEEALKRDSVDAVSKEAREMLQAYP